MLVIFVDSRSGETELDFLLHGWFDRIRKANLINKDNGIIIIMNTDR